MPPSPESKRACDQCRKRKIKCDSTDPCSFCRISSRTCSYDCPVGKRGPKGPRFWRRARENKIIPTKPAQRTESPIARLRDTLAEAIRNEMPGVSLSMIANQCISLYFQRSFPILHEASLRANVTYFFGFEGQDILPNLETCDGPGFLPLMRAFAVLTAFCAAQLFLYSKSQLRFGQLVALKFLLAARGMLREYEYDDRRDPDATSLQVRMLLSTSFQQNSGETGLAWHIVGEAGLIARRMRLYSEGVVSQYSPLEAAMLRNAFWALYTADASAECMQNRGLVLHEPLFDAELDLSVGNGQVPLIGGENTNILGAFERQVSRNFHHIRRIWALAARLMRAIRAFGRASNNIDHQLSSETRQIAGLAHMYSQFTASLDDMPHVLQPPVVFGQEDSTVSSAERRCYISQRYRLLSAYYYAKLRAIHECTNLGLSSVVGLRDDDASLANEQVNIARDFIHNLQSVEFHYLGELGEPEVEVTRAVGSILLAIKQGSNSATSRQRALVQLNVLVDILARLDSQASEKLTLQLAHRSPII